VAAEVALAFAVIAAAYRVVRSNRVLRLSAAPLFATWFLLSKVEGLTDLLPNVSIELESSIASVDLIAGRYDLALTRSDLAPRSAGL
jgi:DNA-binding transcriptional LysR family regulator